MSFEDVLRLKQGIYSLSRSLTGQQAFEEVHVLIPDPRRPEPAFIRATSWLYCLYFEAGRVSLKFLRRVGEAYSLMERGSASQHVDSVRVLRTELHHNLGFGESDQETRDAAEMWRRKACGTALPQTDEEWSSCYSSLVSGACSFLTKVDQVVRRIEADGKQRETTGEWIHRLQRSWAAAEFDPIIQDAKYRLGRRSLDVVKFRNRHIDRWRKHLEILEDGFDFDYEATRLIEKTLLNDDTVLLPITGNDLLERLQIVPGPEVGRLLDEARKHFETEQCSREELLDHVASLHDPD